MTNLLYLYDTYLFETTATVVDIQESEKGTAVILNQTNFYPQGGGQPADHGTITSPGGVFEVSDVRLDPEGVVWHFGNGDGLKVGDEVTLNIDSDRRLLNARAHSGGHLIDVAVRKAGIEGITPTKGYHFNEGPYVQYDGVLEDAASFMELVEQTSNELIEADIAIIAEDVSPEDAAARGIWAPPGKSARFVYFEGYTDAGCGCGGTHVARSKEIGPITIRSIKSKKGATKISYTTS